MWHKLKRLLEWLPLLLIVVVAIGAAYYVTYDKPSKQLTTVVGAKFEPVTSRSLQFITPGPYKAGQAVVLENGICNTSSDVLAMTVSAGLREDADPLIARTILVFPPTGQPLQLVPLQPGCLGTDPINGTIPIDTPQGTWRAYISLAIMGKQSGELQRITLLTDAFQVVP